MTKLDAKFGVARAFVTAMLAKESAYAGVREPLNNALRAQAFRLAHNLGALLKACWLPVEKVQQRVWASLEAPKGEA